MSFDYTLPCLLLSRDSLETICASRILHPFQVSTWNPFQGARRASAASVSVGLVWAPGKNMKNIVFGIDGHHLAMDQRWSKSCHGTIFFWSWRVKTTCFLKTDHNGFSQNDQKIWCFGLSRILYILYIYILIYIYILWLYTYIWCYITCAIFRSRWFTKKGPQICSPCSPNSGEGCMDATGWNNSVVVPWKQRDLTINHWGLHSSTMKN